MSGIIDVHAHILPGVDDGARDWEEACRLLYMAARQGVSAVIATPHEIRRKNGQRPEETVKKLEQEVQKKYPDFRIYLGQENFYHEDLLEQLKSGEALTMAGSRYVLIEFAVGVSYRSLYRGIYQLLQSGYWPILAHVERYGCLRDDKNLQDMISSGCLMQMNYRGLPGKWFQAETRWRRKQLLLGRIDFLGTDMHRVDFRPPEISGPVMWLKGHVGEEALQRMAVENPRSIINKEWISRRR